MAKRSAVTDQIKVTFVVDKARDGALWQYLADAAAKGENMSRALRVLMREALEFEPTSDVVWAPVRLPAPIVEEGESAPEASTTPYHDLLRAAGLSL